MTKSHTIPGSLRFGPGCVHAANAINKYAIPEVSLAAGASGPIPGERATVSQGTKISKETNSLR